MLEETIITETPPLSSCYGRLGQQVRIPITGNRAKRVLPQKLGHALACRTRVRTPAHRPGALQPPCPYAMLVPSDVHKRIEGLLP